MDQAIRNKLRNVVTQCRKLLEERGAGAPGQFGIYAGGKKDEVQVWRTYPRHLTEEDQCPPTSWPTSSISRPSATSPRTPWLNWSGDRLHAPEPPLRLQDDGGPGSLHRRAEVPGGGQRGLKSQGSSSTWPIIPRTKSATTPGTRRQPTGIS